MREEHSGTIQESCKLAISWSTSYMLHYVTWKKWDTTPQQRAVLIPKTSDSEKKKGYPGC